MITTLSKLIAITTEPLVLLALAIIISALLYLYTDNLARKHSAILLFTTSIATGLIIKLLKTIVQAPRPISNLIQETGYSFPSGHTTFAVVFFGLLTYIFATSKPRPVGSRQQRVSNWGKIPAIITSIILILIIALSRLHLQAHYPIDIIGGLATGTIILTIAILIHKKLSS